MEFEDYRNKLKTSLLDMKQRLGKPYNFQGLANACRIQKTYLSNVIKMKAHLSTDQIFHACVFLQFNEQKTQYLFDLSEWNKSVSQERKRQLETSILSYLKYEKSIKSVISKSTEIENNWYSLNVNAQLIRIFLTIEKYQRQPEKICQLLHMEEVEFSQTLAKLLSMGLIQKDQSRLVGANIHSNLDRNSGLFQAFIRARQAKVNEFTERDPSKTEVNFSVVISGSIKTYQTLNKRIRELIKTTEEEITGDKEEEVFMLNISSLKIS